jgi:geranylgeranyl reductase
MNLKTKVLVVGGGPAGATAARVLAENGLDIILLEKNFSFRKPCGGGVTTYAFNEFGIPRTAIKKEVEKIRIISPKGESLDIPLRGESLAIVERGEFDNILRKQAEKKGAHVIEGEFLSLKGQRRYRSETMTGGVQCAIESEYLIAADGINSRVRRSLGMKLLPCLYAIIEHIQGLQAESCEFWFGFSHAPTFYSWTFPATDGISIGTGCLEPKKIKLFFERFKERKGINHSGYEMISRIPMWKGDIYNVGNIVFAGDSAGQVLPLTYEGIYYAMKSGELAARAIIEGRVENYKKIWKSTFYKRFVLMDKLKSYFLKDDASAERLFEMHKNAKIQEASLRLWINKDTAKGSLLSYINLFGKFLS